MLGLIDDLPDRRERRRELMMWGLLGLAVVLFIVLVWVTAPTRQNSTVGSGQNASGEPKSDYAQNVGRASCSPRMRRGGSRLKVGAKTSPIMRMICRPTIAMGSFVLTVSINRRQFIVR